MEIPKYIVTSLASTLPRIINKAEFTPNDTKTANAIRIARNHLRKIIKMIEAEKGDKTHEDKKQRQTTPCRKVTE